MTGPILVTGAAGFAGGHLLDLLQSDSVPIVGWRRPVGPPSRPLPGVEWMDVELLDRESVADAVSRIRPSAIYHLAGAAHVGQSWQHTRETYEANVRATSHLFDAVRALRDWPRVLVPSSAHIYAPQPRPIREDDELRPGSPYAVSKLATEMLAEYEWRADHLPVIIARSFNHVGPRQDPSFVAPSIARQIALIEHGRLEPVLTMGNLEPKRDLTDVRDTVRAYAAMMARARPGLPYNVCSARGISVGDLVQAFITQARCDVRVVQDPSRFRPNDPMLLVGDHTRLTTDTDWTPKIPLEHTVSDLLNYWRDRVKTDS